MNTMALGKEIGNFSLKVTSTSFEADGSTRVHVDGTADGFGTVLGTLTFRGGGPEAKTGILTWRGAGFLDNGDIVQGDGEGSWETLGHHKWRTRSVIRISDGRIFGSDGLVDVLKRTYSGKNVDWS